MKFIFTFIILSIIILACDNEEIKFDTYQGIGTIERTDTLLNIHYYNYEFRINDKEKYTQLSDNDRIIFECHTTQKINDTTLTYNADIISISDDITRNVVFKENSQTPLSSKLFDTEFTPTDMHITRDWRRQDFFNITTLLTTKTDNTDSIMMIHYTNEQNTGNDTITLWLKHLQSNIDSCNIFKNKTISVPLNQFIRDTTERICLRIKYTTIESDTIIKNYTYSWK